MDGAYGVSHFLRAGIWLATKYTNAGPLGYTQDIIDNLWMGVSAHWERRELAEKQPESPPKSSPKARRKHPERISTKRRRQARHGPERFPPAAAFHGTLRGP